MAIEERKAVKIMSLFGHLFLSFLDSLPPFCRNRIYVYSKGYVSLYEGINNVDIKTNGELGVIRRFIPHCKVVFDVGSNVGEWASFVLQHNPQARIHCFEPSLFTFRELMRKNFPSNVIRNNFGLSSSEGEAKLLIFKEGDGLNSLYRRENLEEMGISPQAKEERVQLQTLDHYCDQKDIRKIDFLKIDVEGHELEVLKGAKKMLSEERIGMVQFEYGGCNIDSRVLLKDLFGVLQNPPFEFYKIFPKRIQKVERYSPLFENFQYSNWLAVHKKSPLLSCLPKKVVV